MNVVVVMFIINRLESQVTVAVLTDDNQNWSVALDQLKSK